MEARPGDRFGRFTVISEAERRKGQRYFTCRCDCGNVKDVNYRSLIRGLSTSCGCYRTERMKAAVSKDLTGMRIGRLLVIRRDPERWGCWICQCECGQQKSIRGSDMTRKDRPTQSCGCIQREITGERGKRIIHDISHDQIEQNMRLNTNLQVIGNQDLPKNNTSGHKGVSWNKERNKWEAYIKVHRTRIYLGKYTKYEDAVKARENAEETYFAPLLEKHRQEILSGKSEVILEDDANAIQE